MPKSGPFGNANGEVGEEEAARRQERPELRAHQTYRINSISEAPTKRVVKAKRPLPLSSRRDISDPPSLRSPPSLQPKPFLAEKDTSLAIESVLVDLQKLQSTKQQLSFPVTRSPPVSHNRRVYFSDPSFGGGSKKEVPYSLGSPLFGQTTMPPADINNSRASVTRKITDEGGHRKMNSAGSNGHNAAAESVVPDLMEVYDALTQSSTPQPGGMYPPASYGTEHQVTQDYYAGHTHQQQILPPALPPAGATRQSYRSRSIKSVASSDESYSDVTSGSNKRKAAGRKKGKDDSNKKSSNDSRWSKRFTWPDELHRDFVAAVFEVGLKHSSPSAIMEHMKQNPDVTSERVKSHLQKYRLNRQKSRNEFMNSYDRALNGFKNNPHDFDDDGDHSFSCGEVAALLTHSVQTEGARDGSQSSTRTRAAEQAPVQRGSSPQDHDVVSTLHLPLLSEEENQSPLGQTFGYLVGMFQTLSLELEMKRRAQESTQSHTNNGHVQYQYHQQYHQSLEEAAASAASINIVDPSMYEVANVVPHAIVTKGSTESPAVQPYNPVGGIYRVQSHGVQQDRRHTTAPQVAYHQERQSVHQPPQDRHVSAAHTYQQAPPPSGHVSHPPHQASSVSVSVSTQNSAAKPSLVPCPLDNSSASPGNASAHGSGRTLEAQKQSSIMKQDMKSQKAFQNKMRALKEVELNKYGGRENSTAELSVSQQGEQCTHESSGQQEAEAAAGQDVEQAGHDRNGTHSPLQNDEGLDHDFWNSEDVDGQLFDFLMNP